MAKAKGVSLKLAEVYKQLCPECQAKLKKLVQDRIGEQVFKKALSE